MTAAIDRAIAAIPPPDESARRKARVIQSRLTKPEGALGRLEELHVWAAGVLREATPPMPPRTIVVAAGDHGIARQGVSAYPAEVTSQMVLNMLAGGAAINVLAKHAGAEVRVVDAGVDGEIDHPRLVIAKVRRGTGDITCRPAMHRDEAEALIERGIALAQAICTPATTAIGLGDMGIGNTTSAAALTSAMTGASPAESVGRGTGIDDAALARKVQAIERALDLHAPNSNDPLGVLACVGGCEIAFLAGVALGAASSGAPVVLDGYPTTAAALIAGAMAPASVAYMVASHRSPERGHGLALAHLGLPPVLDLQMRLGEGTGAALAMTLLEAALRIPREMATFDSAGVSGRLPDHPGAK